MLRLKTSDARKLTGARRTGRRAYFGVLATGVMGLLMTGAMQAQSSTSSSTTQTSPTTTTTTTVPIANSKIALAALPTYDNKYEIYGGLNFMNFQAGQSLPKRMNLGGGEVLGTYWLPGDHWFTRDIGLAANYRIDAGTTPVFANAGITQPNSTGGTGINNRPLVYLNTFMGGVQYRTRYKNQYAALNFHAYGGASHGTFNYSFRNLVVPIAQAYASTGLYSNRTSPIAAVGASLDFNRSKNWAIRVSPDLIFEHFGTETREFFSISAGVVYRIGKEK
ncbi:hypothetical protein [Granulicella sp. S190]|uniref:hypothetical protein n=1 Tax=Granulicella sp. S190 TaxID=1747226 RepID=UPI00131D2013|nr:hypothetical protein [Granulicella sp. S190]